MTTSLLGKSTNDNFSHLNPLPKGEKAIATMQVKEKVLSKQAPSSKFFQTSSKIVSNHEGQQHPHRLGA
jgi:hypothetical protein